VSRRYIALATVSLLLLTTGCTALSGYAPAPGDPGWLTEDGLNATRLADAHDDRVTAAGDVTVVRTTEYRYEDGVPSDQRFSDGETRWLVDLGGDRFLERQTRGNRTDVMYATSEATYFRDGTDRGLRYDVDENLTTRHFRPDSVAGLGTFERGFARWGLTRDGTTKRGLATVYRFTGQVPAGNAPEPEQVRRSTVTVLVDEHGLVRTVTFRAVGSTSVDGRDDPANVTRVVTYRWQAVGLTSVPRPHWLSAADRAAANRTSDLATTPSPEAVAARSG
jgi:hypothetical protein